MKRYAKTKKLELNRKTLYAMTDEQNRRVVAGAAPVTNNTDCCDLFVKIAEARDKVCYPKRNQK